MAAFYVFKLLHLSAYREIQHNIFNLASLYSDYKIFTIGPFPEKVNQPYY